MLNLLISNSHWVALPSETILDTISLKNRRFHGKRATKTTSPAIDTHRGSIQSRRYCALRTFPNSSTPSSLYTTLLKHRKMFYIILQITCSLFNYDTMKKFFERFSFKVSTRLLEKGSRDDKSIWILFSPRLASTQYLINRKKMSPFS